jgi:ParB family chromosome partitioning protein
MAKKRIGIDALFQPNVPSAVPEEPGATTLEVAIDRLTPNARQPRTHFDETALADLTASVRAHGVLQPILVTDAGSGNYEIVAGERRWRAARAAALETVPVRILELDDHSRLAVAIVENLQREDLNPIEEAEGYIALLADRLRGEPAFAAYAGDDEGGGVVRLLRALNNRSAGNTKDNVVLSLEPAVAEVFDDVGRVTWRSFVAHRLPLLSMPDEVKSAVRGGLPYTKARAIARVTAERCGGDASRARKLRRALLEEAATEGLSVRALRSRIDRELGIATLADRRARESERAGIGAKLDELRTRLDEVDAAEIDETRRAAVARSIDELLALL